MLLYRTPITEDFIPRTFSERVTEGLKAETIRRLRRERKHKKKKKKKSTELKPEADFELISRDSPYFMNPLSTMPGPASFGPVSVGGIMRHS